MEESGNSLAEIVVENNRPTISQPIPFPIRHFCIDMALILGFFFGMEVLARNVGPHESGFFCTDKSIRLPYAESTFSLSALIFYCVSLNLTTVFCVELYRGIQRPNALYSKYEQYRPTFTTIGIRVVIFFCYFISFELLVLCITTYTKYPIGRLRPHFIEVCKPVVELPSGNRSIYNNDCKDLEEVFLTNYTCSSGDQSAVKEARLSFFSGHSSLAMGASTYAILYLQYRLAGKMNCKLVIPILQVLFGGCGLFISYSRIFDYKHHWTDVSVGIWVGITVMFMLCRYVAGFFTSHQFISPPTNRRSSSSTPRNSSQDQTTNTSSLSTKRSFEWTEAYS